MKFFVQVAGQISKKMLNYALNVEFLRTNGGLTRKYFALLVEKRLSVMLKFVPNAGFAKWLDRQPLIHQPLNGERPAV